MKLNISRLTLALSLVIQMLQRGKILNFLIFSRRNRQKLNGKILTDTDNIFDVTYYQFIECINYVKISQYFSTFNGGGQNLQCLHRLGPVISHTLY
jgi:hypothetical protein